MTNPWETEPNEKRWKHAGFHCLAKRNMWGWFWLGYIVIPEDHPWYGLDHNILSDIDVHGGITYCSPGIHEDFGQWLVGFDCGHGWDYRPSALGHAGDPLNYRTLQYVVEETNKLAEQAAQAGLPPPKPKTRVGKVAENIRRKVNEREQD